MSKISIIVAASDNLVIGNNNEIPWRLPTDMKYFKKITEGSVVLMGRKCWESIPAKFRPLPNRFNGVITRNKDYYAEGAVTYKDLDYVLNFFKEAQNQDEVFVIGGSEIYDAAFKIADKLYLTRVLANFDGNVLLKGFDEQDWTLVSCSETLEENGCKFKFEVYDRKLSSALAHDEK